MCNNSEVLMTITTMKNGHFAFSPNKRVHRLANLDLARNLAIGEGGNKVCYTQASRSYLTFTLPVTSNIEYKNI